MKRTTLLNALPIVAAALGRKFGVQVRVGGLEAFTDGNLIQLPDLPEDAATRALAWGYLAHEAAHVCYTDFAAYRKGAQEGPLQETLQNRIEDVRIERELAGPFPGTRASIEAVVRRLMVERRLSAPAADDHPARVLAGYVLLALRHEVLGQTALADEARKAEEVLRQVFPANVVGRLRALMGEVGTLSSTAETVQLARRIRRMLEDEAQPEEGPKSGGDEDTGEQEPERGHQACGGGLDDDSESQGDAGAEEVKTPQSAGDKHGTGDSESQGQDIAGEGSSDETATRPRDTGTDPREGKDEGKPDDGAVPTDGGESGEVRSHDALAAVLSADAGACDGDPFAGVADLLRTAAVPSTEIKLPTLEVFTGDREAGTRLLARVQAESARLSARLQGLVQSSRMDRQRAVRRGRRLDRSRLHRIAVADERVFARKARRRTAFTAVHLLVDLSGSMNTPVTRANGKTTLRANLALESALSLALALSGIPGVTVAATAFPGLDGRERRVTRLLAHGAEVRAATGDFTQHPRGGTPMAQALWYAAADLLGREETRRIAIVLTDGVPNNRPETLRLLALCGEAGVETVGVGIQTDIGHLRCAPRKCEARGA